MKTNCLSLVSCFLALLFSSAVAATSSGTASQRDLKELANIVYSEIVPQMGQHTSNRRFSVKVKDSDGIALKEVKLMIRLEGSGDKYDKEKMEYDASSDTWVLDMEDLEFGNSYEWYLEAKNTDKVKRASTADFPEFSFVLSDTPAPPTDSTDDPTSAPSPAPSNRPTTTEENAQLVEPFTVISPQRNMRTQQRDQTFSVKVVIMNAGAVTEVKLLYKSRGQTSYNTELLQYTGADNIWTFQTSLTNGSYDWYCEAKTSQNTRMKSIDGGRSLFSFEIEAPNTPVDVDPPTTGDVTYGLQSNCFTPNRNRFDICLDLVGQEENAVKSWMSAFAEAREDWEKVITGHVAVWQGVSAFMKSTGKPIGTDVPEPLDDLYIMGSEVYIDGRGKILGSAGPTVSYTFQDGRRLPVAGRMRFDEEDIANLESRGAWKDVIKHEMGHVLGIGTMWKSSDTHEYQGARGREEWSKYCSNGASPPIELGGGGGTAGGHWDEYCFDNALMTGYLGTGRANPMSVLTVAALEDIGFQVSYDTATAEDLLSSPCCVPYNTRNLRGETTSRELHPKKKKTSSPMSEELYDLAELQAAKELQEARENAPDSLPEGLVYVGGDAVTILAIEEDEEGNEEIKDVTFKWNEVQHRL